MQKRLFMKCVCKFWHHSSIPLPQFPYSVRNFGDLETISSYILCAESQPYICFRFVWPTDLESVLHSLTPTVIISTNFEVDMIIQVIVFLLLIHYMTLWPWLLTFWPWMVHGRSHEDCHCTHIWNPHLRFVHQVWRFYAYSFLSYDSWSLSLDTVDIAFLTTAHAPCHVTCW